MRRLALWLLLVTAGLALLPAAALASGDDATKDGKTSSRPSRPRRPPQPLLPRPTPPSPPSSTGTGATIAKTTPWGGSAGQPAGYRLEYRWPEAQARDVNEVWPLLRSDAGLPQPPYDSAEYRIRASEVSALQVDVLLDGPAGRSR